jgi:hypothetical protein
MLMNEDARLVRVIVDTAIWEADAMQSHPLVNTATLDATGHAATVIDVPASV